jgi:16S rRNA (uracil1498-N3)-methyltransferase
MGLDDKAWHYVVRVMRRRDGAALRLVSETQGEWLATVEYDDPRGRHGSVRLERRLRNAWQEEAALGVMSERRWLVAPLIKPDLFLWMIEKATEIGITDIVPLASAYSQHGLPPEGKMGSALREALEQSERVRPVVMHPVWDLRSGVRPTCLAGEVLAVASIHQRGRRWGMLERRPTAVLVGPEGGLSPEEEAALQGGEGTVLVDLGTTILRSETAAIGLCFALIGA